MKAPFVRFVSFVFLLSVLISPQAALIAAQEDIPAASPVVETTTPEPTEEAPDPASISSPNEGDEESGDTKTEVPEEAEVATPGAGRMSPSSGIGINAVIQADFHLSDLTWVDTDNQVTMGLILYSGFSATAGDTIVLNYTSDTLELAITQPAIPGLPVTVSTNSAAESVTLTFNEDYIASTDMTFPLVLNGEIHFPECRPTSSGYDNGASIQFWTATSWEYAFVPGDICPVAEHPGIEWVGFIPELDAIQIELNIPSAEIEPGFVATITYQQDKLNIPNGTTTEFYVGGMDILNPISVATAVANDGLITITFHDIEYEDGYWNTYHSAFLGATLEPVACVDVTEKDITDLGRLFFVATPGETFVSHIDVALCNAAPASKTGVLSDDGTEVYWTVDSGDLIYGGAILDGFLVSGQQFDCESIEVQLISPSSEGWYDVICEGWEDEQFAEGFEVDFGGDGPVRAIVTVTGIIDQEFSFGSVVNCAVISAGSNLELTALNTRDNNAGWGTTVCAEVHTAGIGDSISNTVSSPTIYQGETLTYTVNFSTTTGLWLHMSLDDVLPQGFDVTSVTCTFSPAALAEGVCEVGDDNALTVGLNRFSDLEGELESMEGGQITLVIEGIVTAEPGTELVSQACGVRAFEIPGMPPFFSQIGSGSMCATAGTLVLQVPGETPTPSPTPDPTSEPTETPTPDPTGTVTPNPTESTTPEPTQTATADPIASPTASAESDPTATSGVTGLPSTGTSGPSAASALFVAAIAAGILIAAGIGIQMRPRD